MIRIMYMSRADIDILYRSLLKHHVMLNSIYLELDRI
jgi:hypothetical protein